MDISEKILEDFSDLTTRHGHGLASAKALLIVADRLERIAEAIGENTKALKERTDATVKALKTLKEAMAP